MRLRFTWKLGRIAGIDIGVHPSWLVIYALIAWSAIAVAPMLADSFGMGRELSSKSTFALGLIASLVVFASVVAHEYAHALIARKLGIPTHAITLFLFGGVATIVNEPGTPADELRIALAGPALSFVLALAFVGIAVGLAAAHWLWGATLGAYLAVANAMLAIFNLLPAYPSDGGRVLRSLLWMRTHSQARATIWASRISLIVALGLASAGCYFTFGLHEPRGLWWIVIAMFLSQVAIVSARYAQTDLALEQMPVGDCMLKTLIPVPANTMVSSFIGEVAGRPGAAYPVVDEGTLVGLADVRSTSGVPLRLWNETTMRSVMTPIAHAAGLSADENARMALSRLQESGLEELPVYNGSELIGVVSRASIFSRLHASKAR